jgi:hypothetical protein
VQVADDQWCPPFGKDLGAPGNRAVLTVRPHEASVAQSAIGCEVQIFD